MKRCKSCGAVVHIESNTCPNCGGHSFEVMDVKVCPLCGKVNAVESSFCEYCGKSFVTEGYDLPPEFPEEETDQRSAPEDVFPVKRPISDSERAMLRYLTLRPEVASDGKEKKYAYYVSEENVPIVILPTFDTDKEKNIKVEIMLVPERQVPENSVVAPEEHRAEEGTRIQLPNETKKSDIFAERKAGKSARVGFSLLLSLFALAAVAGFFLPLLGGEPQNGLSLVLGMLGYHDGGQAVIEALRADGILGKLTYVAILVFYTVMLLSLILNLCFMKHTRAKKVVLLILVVIAIVSCVFCAVGNFSVLGVTIGKFGFGFYVSFGALVLELLLNIFLYDR